MRLKRAPKRGGSANAGIANMIDRIQRVAQDELPSLLDPVVKAGWTWPRTDLQHWIYPLNRFDEVLEQIIRDYDLSDMQHCQTNNFTPRTKELLLSVLGFQKLLLENSTNRKIFNGFDVRRHKPLLPLFSSELTSLFVSSVSTTYSTLSTSKFSSQPFASPFVPLNNTLRSILHSHRSPSPTNDYSV